MAGTIEFLQDVIKHAKSDWANKFPAIEDVMIIHNSALAEICPMYMQQNLDKDDTAFYLLAKCNPLKGDCSRQTACAWLEDLFYNKCHCPSSYDVDAGGTMSRQMAISKELLPADNDAEYMDYYKEQMAKLKEMFDAEAKAAKKQEFIDKNGFDPDDPDIIDIPSEEPASLPGSGTTSTEQSAGTAVGMPKPIWYGVVFHANGFGMKLGYDKKVWTLSQGNTTVNKLGSDSGNAQLTEEENDEMMKEALDGTDANQVMNKVKAAVDQVMNKVKEAIDLAGHDTGLGIALTDVYKKFFGPLDECGKCGDAECEDGEKCGLKESEDDLKETEQEISEILKDDVSEDDIEGELNEYAKVEDEACEEDDDVLSESVIRHATMLAKEIW